MKKIKLYKKNIIITFLLLIIIFSSFIGFLDNSPLMVFAEDKKEQIGTKDEPSDGNFSIRQDLNSIYTGDKNGRTMSIPVYTSNKDFVYPEKTCKDHTIYCTWKKFLGGKCGKRTDSCPFNNATLSFTISKVEGTIIGSPLLTFYLFCSSKGEWSVGLVEHMQGAKDRYNLRLKKYPVLNEEEKVSLDYNNFLVDFVYPLHFNPFTIYNDTGYILDFLITPTDPNLNFNIEFTYDYFYYKHNTGVTNGCLPHQHWYNKHIENNPILPLRNKTNCLFEILKTTVFEKLDYKNLGEEELESKLIEFYSDSFVNDINSLNTFVKNIMGLNDLFVTKEIKISFLRPIILKNNLAKVSSGSEGSTENKENLQAFEKVLPFAYKYTTRINVEMYNGRIRTDYVLQSLKNKGVIGEYELENFLKIFNSNTAVGPYLDETIDSSNNNESEYSFSYYPTYIVYLRDSSGHQKNITLELESLAKYYSNFCIGSGKTYSLLSADCYKVVYNRILNYFGLSGFTFPNGLNDDNLERLTENDLYGYWGFAIIPKGGGFDGLLSRFFDSKVTSNGLAIPYTDDIGLSSSALLQLQNDFHFSWLSSTLGNVVNNFNGSDNASFYMFYVSEIENEYCYVISENGSLKLEDTSSLTSQAVEKTVKTAVKGFKKISSKFLSFFDNKVFLYIVFGVLGFAGVMLVLKLFLKKGK